MKGRRVTMTLLGIVTIIGPTLTGGAQIASNRTEPNKTILQVLQESSDATRFSQFVRESGLFADLTPKTQSSDPRQPPPPTRFTVLAPTNRALGLVPGPAMDALRANKELFLSFMRYHTLPEDRALASFEGTGEVKTLEGEKVTAVRDGGDLRFGRAKVILPSVTCSDGTIYFIDRVLVPPSFSSRNFRLGGG